MKENKEWVRSDLAIDPDIQIDCDIGQEILAYVETWFDVDLKFGIQTSQDDSIWVNLYARYNPYSDTLRMEYEISSDLPPMPNQTFDYEPTASEAQLVKELIAEKIRELYNKTPIELCEVFREE